MPGGEMRILTPKDKNHRNLSAPTNQHRSIK